MRYLCVKLVLTTNILVEPCALMNMFFFSRNVIGACALIRMNMVVNIFDRASGFQQSYNVSNQR